jgi:magnesium transporter
MITVLPPHPEGQAAPHREAVWIDLLAPDANEIRLVEETTGLRLPTRDDLASLEQSSRLSFERGQLRVAAPVIAEAETDHPWASHIGMVLTPELIVTIRHKPVKVFEAAAAKFADGAPKSSVEVFTVVLESIVARQADLLEEARARLDELSHQVFRKSATSPRRALRSSAAMRERLQFLGRMGERTSMIRDSLLGVDRIIDFSLEAARTWFTRPLARRIEAAREDIAVLNLFEEHLLGKVQFLLDAVLGFISIEQNDVFKVLTIASVVGIFPTLVAGWYGMNFHNMPEYGWPYGYQFGIGVIVFSTILPLAWFKWRGWM